MLLYKQGDNIPREAYVVCVEDGKSFEYDVSLSDNRILSRKKIDGQAAITSEEYV
jgi:hypothetical protein